MTKLRIDQSIYAGYRTPSRKADYAHWLMIKTQILEFWQDGLTSLQMAKQIKSQLHANQHKFSELKPQTVRGYYQRIYNEYGLKNRSPSSALAEAYRRGDLPCPCPHHQTP